MINRKRKGANANQIEAFINSNLETIVSKKTYAINNPLVYDCSNDNDILWLIAYALVINKDPSGTMGQFILE